MRLYLLASALVTIALATPFEIKTFFLSSPLQLRSGTIALTLGTRPVNVGDISISSDRSALYANIYSALQRACPNPQASSCTGVAAISVRVEKQVITSCKDCFDCISEDLHVRVASAQWNSDPKAFDLLVGAVAGSVERGTYPDAHCRSVAVQDGGNAMRRHRHCNSFDYVSVMFPGNQHMNVTLSGSSQFGAFDCWRIGETAVEGVRDLQSQIEKIEGDGDLYVDWRCGDL